MRLPLGRWLIAALALAYTVIGMSLTPITSHSATLVDATTFGFGANLVWPSDGEAQYTKDIEGTFNAAVKASPHLALVGNVNYGFTEAYLRGYAGVRLRVTDARNTAFSMAVGIGRQWVSERNSGHDEYKAQVSAAYRILPYAILGAEVMRGFDSHGLLSIAAVRFPLKRVKPEVQP